MCGGVVIAFPPSVRKASRIETPRVLWIENNHLFVRAWPGGYEFWRDPDGSFAYAHGCYGGNVWGHTTARTIAERLWKDHRERTPLALSGTR